MTSKHSGRAEFARRDAPPGAGFRLGLAAWTGVAVALFWVLVAAFAPWIAPYSPYEFVARTPYLPIGGEFVFGTDYLGRDVLSRLVHGARLTIGMAFAATCIATAVGSVLGLVAALKGGVVDAVLSRGNDALLSIPTIMMGLVVIAALGSSISILVGTTGLIYASSVFRIARALGMNLRVMDFVVAARARGEGMRWLLFQEVLPNAALPLLVDFGVRFTFAVLFMSSLSFLGLGVQPPQADWGSMVRDSMPALSSGSLVPLVPAFAIASLTIGLNLILDEFATRSGREVARKLP